MSDGSLASSWGTTTIGKSSYLRGRIGWQGLKAAEFLESGPYLVTGTDFQNGRIDWDTCYHVSDARFAEAAYIHLRNGDVLVTKDGTIGKIAQVENCPSQAVLNSGVFLLRCRDGSYDHRYLFYVLQSDRFSRFLADNLAGSTISHLYQYVFERFEFPVPDRLEQVAIVNVLTAVDRAADEMEALLAKHYRVRAGLMCDLLTRGIDERGNLRSRATHAFKDSPLGLIPVSWEARPLADLLADVDPAMRSGPFGSALLKRDLSESGVPYLGIDNVFPEAFRAEYRRFIPTETAKRLHRYRVRPGDVMVTIMGTVGRSCVVPNDIGEALSSKHVWTITLDHQKYLPNLACYQINYAPWVLTHFARDEQGGIMASIKADTLRSTVLPVPPIEEQKCIEAARNAINEEIRELMDQVSKTRSLKSALMQDLLTGKRRVAQLLSGA